MISDDLYNKCKEVWSKLKTSSREDFINDVKFIIDIPMSQLINSKLTGVAYYNEIKKMNNIWNLVSTKLNREGIELINKNGFRDYIISINPKIGEILK